MMASVAQSVETGQAPGRIAHAMSVDVEDYFHAWALSSAIPKADRRNWPSRVADSTRRVVELFARAQITATFFVVGEVAEAEPDLVREIVAAGHEIGSHSFAHDKVAELGPHKFFEDVRRARETLEAIVGGPVVGFRAPSFSIGKTEWWAYEELLRAGYRYSSSLHPIRHDHYGMVEAPRHPFRPLGEDVDFVEIPVGTIDVVGQRVTCAGGGFFRLFPYVWSRWCLKQHGAGACFYFHPWEIDAGQPRVPDLPWRSRLRHYTGLAGMEAKLCRVLRDFEWGRIDAVGLTRDTDLDWRPDHTAGMAA